MVPASSGSTPPAALEYPATTLLRAHYVQIQTHQLAPAETTRSHLPPHRQVPHPNPTQIQTHPPLRLQYRVQMMLAEPNPKPIDTIG